MKKCFEFACEANFRKATIPEYKREYEEIEDRSEQIELKMHINKNTDLSKSATCIPE